MPDLQYPRHMHKFGGLYRIVQDEADALAAVGDGWDFEVPLVDPALAPTPVKTPEPAKAPAVSGRSAK